MIEEYVKDERLSNIERLWRADEIRRAGPSIEQCIRTPAPLTIEQQQEQMARALPDEQVKDDAEVVRLMADAEAAQARLDFINKGNRRHFQELEEAVSVQLTAAREALVSAAIDDAVAGDVSFARYTAQAGRIADLEHRHAAARAVVEALNFGNSSNIVRAQLTAQAEAARRALDVARLDAKRRAIQQTHPDTQAA